MHSTPTLLRAARALLAALLLLLLPALPAAAQLARGMAPSKGHSAPQSHQGHHHDDLAQLLNMHDQEIHFTENKGQFSHGVLYRADFPYGQAVATAQGMVVTAFDPVEVDKRIAEGFAIEEEQRQGRPARELTWRRRGHAWQLRFVGGNASARAEGRDAHPEVSNYFVGDRQATDVRSFQEVWYRDVYPGIDARYYPAKDGSLEYDLIVMPGADAGRIAIAHDGIGKMRVNEQGELLIETLLGELAHPAPYVYQRINGEEIAVASRYTIEGDNTLRFELGAYDKQHPLVIDPIAMRWATWINTNSSDDNHGHCIWVDPADGAIYVVARVVGTTDQITPGAFDETANGNLEIIVGKYLEPSAVGGSGTRVWQTYIGGGGDDNPYAMEQGPDGNLYITGQTSSTNFPLLGGSAFSGSSINQQSQSGIDVFVLKINTAGSSIKAAVVGGNGADDNYDVRLAANGDVFVAGSTTSTNLSTLNPGSGASNTNNGGADVLLFRVNQDLSSLVWMRNYGGSSTDRASIMLHNPVSGDLFVGGNTSSTNFPTVSPRQSTRGGTSAGFIQRLNGTTAATVWSSYFSSDANDDANLLCMEFNAARTELYFGGVTEGLNSANITAGAYDTGHNGSNDFYVGRMSIDQNFLGGTYVGGSSNEVNMMGLNVDQNNDVYVFGYSNSTNFPMSTAPNVPLQTTNQGSNDKVFFKLESDLSALEFSTYYGGTADDYDPVGERGIKFSNCRIYTIVTARSNNIPLTQGALNTTKVSGTTRYEPGLVVWANPPDLLGNSITYQGVAICPGATPGDIIGSEPTYVLPTIVRNNSASSYPSFGSAATYQWQISTDSLTWTNIPGATGQNLSGAQIGALTQDTYIRRIIGGDACILAGAADQVVKVRIMTVEGTVTDALCNGAATGSITATADGQAPFTYIWSDGQSTQTAGNLAAGPYTVTVTDFNGCSATADFVVGQPAPLSANINTTLDACNTSTGGASASGTGGTPGYGYAWSTGAVGPNITGVPAGLYSVTVTDFNQCSVSIPVNIQGTVPPVADAGADAEINCATGPSIQLNGSSTPQGLQFSWSGPGIASGGGTANPSVNQAGIYTLTVTDPQTGCSSTDVVEVTVNTTSPSAQASGGTITCTNACVQLTGSGNGSFSWSGPDGFTSTEQNPTVCVPGTYILTVTGANGCTSTATAQVNSDTEAPAAEATGGSINCNLLSTQLQGSGDGSLAWTGPNGFTSSEADPVVNVAGTYTLTVTAANGCTTSILADVTISGTTASAGANGGEVSCLQPTVQLQGASLTPNVTYAWSGPGAFTSTDQNPVVSLPGTYTLTVTGASIQAEDGPIACVGTAEALVTGNTDEPGAVASGGTITCNNECVTLSGSGNGSFAWSGPDGFTSTEQNPTVCAPGTYTLTVTGTNGCTSTATALVDEDLVAPGAQAAGGTITCNNACVQLSGSGNGSFAWSGPNGFTSTEQNPTVCAPGTYTLTVTGSNGCTSVATAEVARDVDEPGAQASGGTITCNNECVTLSGSGNGSFAWSGPDGFTSTVQNPTVCAPGTYTLTVTGTNGCTSTATAEVGEDTDLPGAQASGGTLTCNNECVTLQGVGNGSYSWTGPNGFISIEQNPTVCAPGTYTLTVTGANGCTSTATAEVGEDTDLPGAQASGGTITCNNECVTLSGSGNGSFAWSGPDGFTSTVQNPTVCVPGTYTLTVTGTNGCTSTATAEVGEDTDLPGAQASGGTLTCNNECVTLQGVGNGSYSWTGPNGFISIEQNPTVCAPGTYTLTVTGANGCTSTATAEVGEDTDLPGAQASGGTITCNNECVQLSGSGNGSFSWSGPNGFTSTEQNPTVCAPGTYTLTVTGANGCTSTATAEVGEDTDLPGAQAAGGTLTCNNECVTLSGSGNGSFSWSGPNGFNSTEQNPTVCAPGTYTLTVTGANGCTSTATAEVGEDTDLPGAQAAGGTLTCNNECVTLQGVGNGSYSWSGPDGFTSAEQNPTVCVPGTYTLTVTGTNGCTSTATAEVGQDVDVPGAQAAGGTLTCNNECVTLQGVGNGSYSWSGPNGFTSAEQNPTVCVPGTYTLTVTGTNGCTSTATAEVGEDTDLPGAQASGGPLTCNNECVTLQGVGNGSYSWSGPDGFTSAEQNPTVCVPGTYTLTVTGANGCTSTATAEAGQDVDVPGAQAAGGTITCNNECVTLQGVGNGSYSWSGPDGFTSTEQNPTVCAPGTYTLTVTGSNGCTSTAMAEVGQDVDVPGAQAAGGTLTCNNECVTLSGSGNGSFAWSGPDGFTSTVQNPTVCVPGTYTLTVTGTNGCTSTATAEVGEDTDLPGAQASGGTLTCNNECVTLQGVGNGSYSWTGPNGFISIEQNPTVCAPGTYTLTVTGANGCTSTATAEVGEDTDLPGAQASGGTITCNNECVTLSGSGNGSFAWSGPDGFTSTEQNPTVCAPGTYTLTVTGANGCTSTATAEVGEDTDLPGAQASGGTITCNNECVTLSGSGNGSFAWSGPDGFTSTEQNPTVCAPGTYTLTVTGANGCTSTATAEVGQDVDVPGAQAAGGTLSCNNECVTLSGSGNGSFAWSGPNGFTSAEQNPTVCAPGTYTLTVTGANGCTSTATAEVGEDTDLPGAQASGGTITCNNECVTLQGMGNGSYSWSGPNGFTSAEQNPTVCAPGTYTLTVTGANGCTSTATAEVDQDVDVPGAQAAGGTLTCNNECVTLQGVGNGSYSWSGPDGFTSAEQNPTVCVPGTYTLTVTGANGCTSTATAEVGQDVDVPGAQAAGGTLTCNNECVTLQGVGNGSYSWSGPNGFTSADQNPTVCAPGTYTLTVTGANGCTSTATAEVDQDVDVPGAQAAGGTLTCNTWSIVLNGAGDGAYSWIGPNGFTSNLEDPVVFEPGTYVLTVTGSNGCTSTASTMVDVDFDLPEAVVYSTLIGCNGEPATLSYSSSSSIAYAAWVYSIGVVGSGPTYSTSTPGTYILLLTGTNGCVNEIQVEVMQDTDCGKVCGPIIESCPPDITVQCADDFSPFALGGEPIFRKKQEDCPEIEHVGWNDTILSNCPYVIRRTFWATDEAGNYASCTQYITLIDEVPPVFTGIPADLAVACDADLDAIQTPDVTAYDECTKVHVAVQHSMVVVPGDCAGSYTIVHTWTANDQCGNVGTATWAITVTDDTPPELSCPVEDLVVECGKLPKPVKCEATDNCSGSVEVEVTDVAGQPDWTGTYVVTRTYTAADDCGNPAQVIQHITVKCTKKPGYGDITIANPKSAMSANASPNPFREETTVFLMPTESGTAQVVVTDLQGRKVADLFQGHVEAGVALALPFRPMERNGGAYIYRIRLNGEEVVGRIMAQP